MNFIVESFQMKTGITLIALLFSPKLLRREYSHDEENKEILKLCKGNKPIYLPTKKKKKQ